MSEVIKIKIALLFGFCLQLVYFTWFLAGMFSEVKQAILIDSHKIGYIEYRVDKLEKKIDKLTINK